jgi:hypothetical protein
LPELLGSNGEYREVNELAIEDVESGNHATILELEVYIKRNSDGEG